MHLSSFLFAVISLRYIPAAAETVLSEQIWGSVIFSLYGDRTPYILPNTYTLTPLGAQQLYSSGAEFRNRYVSPPQTSFSGYNVDTAIYGISEFQLDSNQVTMESAADQFIVASAQAFMQGLYPPLQISSNDTFITSQSSLANGSNILSPLNGYQYPQIYTASRNDENSIWIAGEISCPSYTASSYEYYTSPEYATILDTSAEFYASLEQDFLNGIFTNSSVGFFDAYYIWDYLRYGFVHNTSIADHISEDALLYARTLADQLIFALNGNTSASGSTPGDEIRAVGGRTLATRIVEALYTNIDTNGEYDKMTLLFGSFEPMISFAALAGLATEQTPQFYSIPDPGSSMVFELFSLSVNASGGYPARSDLNVRFLFQNGTGDNSELISYSLFGRDPSQDVMTFDDFVAGMEAIWMPSVTDWCNICSSFSVFCPAFVGNGGAGSSSGPSYGAGSSDRHDLRPAVAGVIGAVVTLVVVAILTGVVAVLGGFRFYRVKAKGRSDLGGFKGGEKLASDPDLTVAKSKIGATVAGIRSPPAGRLHERVGSWELGDQAKAKDAQIPNFGSANLSERRPSFEDDELHVTPFASPIKPDDRV
jgi:hypothetical protein